MSSNSVLDALTEQRAQLEELLVSLDDAGWTTPVPRCPGWSVKDVVLHLCQTDEMATASAQGRLAEMAAGWIGGNVDEGADNMVALERNTPNADVLARWRASSAEQRDSLAQADPKVRLQWVAGTLAPGTLATTRLSENWIHTGDIADALGVTLPTPASRLRNIAWLAWKTLPYAFEREGESMSGPVAAVLTSPDADEWVFGDVDAATTVVRGPGEEWCLVAARRLEPSSTSLKAEGPDADAVLRLVRTYA